MIVTVRLFAGLRRRAQTDTLELELPAGTTVAEAIAALRAGPLPWLPERSAFAVAVDRAYAPDDEPLAAGAELALVPPVSGGG